MVAKKRASKVAIFAMLVEEVPDALGAVTVPALIVRVSPLALPRLVSPFAAIDPLMISVDPLVVPVSVRSLIVPPMVVPLRVKLPVIVPLIVALANVPLVHWPPGPKLGVAGNAEDAHTERIKIIFFI
jgi:hypothetical protein